MNERNREIERERERDKGENKKRIWNKEKGKSFSKDVLLYYFCFKTSYFLLFNHTYW